MQRYAMVGAQVGISYHSPFERKVSSWGDAKVIVSPITANIYLVCYRSMMQPKVT